MKIGLFASLKFMGSGIKVERYEIQHISFESYELAYGINSFCGKVHSAIRDILFEALANSGSIQGTICLDITPEKYDLSRRYETSMTPSQNLRKEIDKEIDDIVTELDKKLCRAIIKSPEYQFQNLCYSQATQAENTK